PLPSDGAPVPPQMLLQRLLVQNFIAVPTPAIRRDAYLEAGGMDPALWYTADWDLYLKLLGLGQVFYHNDALACYRIHGRSLTSSGSRGLGDFRRQLETVVARHMPKLTEGRQQTSRLAAVSIDVNVALAAASRGGIAQVIRALAAVLALGPLG